MRLVVLACLVPVLVWAVDRPLSKDDVRLLLMGGASAQKMVALIEQRGVDFQMNPGLVKQFRDDGADDAVVDALRKAGDKWAASAAAPTPPPDGAAEAASSRAAPLPAVPSTSANSSNNPPAATSAIPPSGTTPPGSTSGSVENKVADALTAADAASSGDAAPPARPAAPAFSLVDLSGKQVRFDDYRGKVLLLDFWAPWCNPCRHEIPEFVRLQDKYRGQGFQVVGLAVDESRARVEEFYRQFGMNYPVAMCDRFTRTVYGGITGLPTTFLIGRDGRIYLRVVGAPVELKGFEMEIRTLLAANDEQPGATPVLPSGMPVADSAAPPAAQQSRPATPPSSSSAAGQTASTVAAAAPAAAPPAAPPVAKPAASAKADLSDPSQERIQQIVQEFATKEKLFKLARDNYTFHQINKVETIGADDQVTGIWQQEWDILYDDAGKRIERVTYAPPDTLKDLIMTQEDLGAMRSITPFVLTSDELPEYDVKYLGHVVVDQLTAYVFSIRPKVIQKERQYFQGVVWVDDRDLQIVKAEGKNVPELKTKKGENLFPRFTTYREQIDGKFWFPTFTIADQNLYFSGGPPVHVKEIVRYTDYKQYKSGAVIKMIGLADEKQSQDKQQGKQPPDKKPEKQ
jgi:thiol-disulfide isomerase/thioredoxin